MQTTTRNNQTLLDIAVQECGTVEAAFEIAERNGLALTDELNTGQKLDIVMTTTREESVVQELAADRIKPATAPSARGDGNGSLRRYRVYGDRNRLCGTMRTIEEIKETICADFMRNESVAGVVRIYAGRQLHVAFQQGIRHRDSVLHFRRCGVDAGEALRHVQGRGGHTHRGDHPAPSAVVPRQGACVHEGRR